MNTKTGGIGEVLNIRENGMNFTLDGIPYFITREYHIYGRRTDRAMWLKADALESFLRRGVLIEWPDELKPKEYIPRYDFQKG